MTTREQILKVLSPFPCTREEIIESFYFTRSITGIEKELYELELKGTIYMNCCNEK
ncbi:MAG: hypothetical protein GVY04_12580 [Cyanobacteria bacterium]|jgi:hypothetical protein|nr:hypothetical protein [Cyanobacteria bacterium GSL.Bin1]